METTSVALSSEGTSRIGMTLEPEDFFMNGVLAVHSRGCQTVQTTRCFPDGCGSSGHHETGRRQHKARARWCKRRLAEWRRWSVFAASPAWCRDRHARLASSK